MDDSSAVIAITVVLLSNAKARSANMYDPISQNAKLYITNSCSFYLQFYI